MVPVDTYEDVSDADALDVGEVGGGWDGAAGWAAEGRAVGAAPTGAAAAAWTSAPAWDGDAACGAADVAEQQGSWEAASSGLDG